MAVGSRPWLEVVEGPESDDLGKHLATGRFERQADPSGHRTHYTAEATDDSPVVMVSGAVLITHMFTRSVANSFSMGACFIRLR